MAKLNVKAFGIACGITWGAGILIMGIVNMFTGWGGIWVTLMGSVYLGYKATFLGAVTGALWGFVDAGIGGLVLAWLYNKFTK